MAECSQPGFRLLSEEIYPSDNPSVPLSPVTNEERDAILAEYGSGANDEDKEDENDEWLPLDEDLLSDALNGGCDRSKHVNRWARSRFDEWRKASKHDMSLPIEKLPLLQLNEMLTRFILQAKKKNGRLYPPSTLSCLFRGIGRIVRREREKIMGETGIRDKYPFNILTDPVFSQSREAFVGMVKKTRKSGNYERPKKKAPVITFSVEKDILADIDHSVTHPMGCIKRLVYYMLTRFGIRAARELYNVKDCDVTLDSDEGGEFVKYGERISKNYNPTITKFDDHHFRKPVFTYEKDFVMTYKQYVRHLPAKERDSEPRNFFLRPKAATTKQVWYAVTPVGVNNLSKWLNVMGSVVSPGTEICNKSDRVSLITRLSTADVPAQVGMGISGHKSLPAYEKSWLT